MQTHLELLVLEKENNGFRQYPNLKYRLNPSRIGWGLFLSLSEDIQTNVKLKIKGESMTFPPDFRY